jgi:hypothetical protein
MLSKSQMNILAAGHFLEKWRLARKVSTFCRRRDEDRHGRVPDVVIRSVTGA